MAGGIREKTPQGSAPEREKAPIARVLISDELPQTAFAKLRSLGFEIDNKPGISADDLINIIGDYDALVVRSKTKVTRQVLEAGGKLKIVVRAGVGIDNIKLDAATERGVIVANTPKANTIAAAEHAVTLGMDINSGSYESCRAMEEGRWYQVKRKDITGKTVGVIGLGNVGKEVAVRWKGLKTNVLAYDPFATQEQADALGVTLVPLEKIYAKSDLITLHVPLTEKTKHLFNKEVFSKLKRGVFLVNDSRGEVIDEEALFEALESRIVERAGLDVFEGEPKINPRYQEFIAKGKLVCTSHIGAQSEEAQAGVADEAAETLKALFIEGETNAAVNIPRLTKEAKAAVAPFAEVGFLIASLARNIHSEGQIDAVKISCFGRIADFDSRPIQAAVIGGLLDQVVESPVNLVNYGSVGKQYFKAIDVQTNPAQNTYSSEIRVELTHGDKKTTVAGVVGHDGVRVVGINDFAVDFALNGDKNILLVLNDDVPNVTGPVTTILGTSHVNINKLSLTGKDGKALMAFLLDKPLTKEQVREIQNINGVSSAQFVKLS